MLDKVRNIGIMAHVDAGKTTTTERILYYSGTKHKVGDVDDGDTTTDFDPLERQKGITINSAAVSIDWGDIAINIIDTPGHADFSGEVERILNMADGCLLLVDAFDGPMPQTKFVLRKALESGLKPVVVINKCDRDGARPDAVLNEVFDLLVELGADDIALDFPVVYASGRNGWATRDLDKPATDMRAAFEAIIDAVPPAQGEPDAPLQMLVTTLDYSEYVGRIAIGRVFRGTIHSGDTVKVISREGEQRNAKVVKLMRFAGLGRVETDKVEAGDLCAVVGIEDIEIGETIADMERPEALPTVRVDEPTIRMTFRINDSPFAGLEGEYVTSRQIRDRLMRELEHNVALKVESGRTSDEFNVSGRGLLHLGILLETMRREGYELSVGKPIVIQKEIDGVVCEPIERLVIDCPTAVVGSVMELVGQRKGELKHMENRGTESSHLVFEAPARGLIGMKSRLMTATQGEAIMHHTFERYAPTAGETPHRLAGVLIANESGQVTSHAVEGLADRGVMFVEPGEKVYTGQIVGEHNRENDLTVNAVRLKQLTNIRAASKEATVTLKGARKLSLEAALEYIEDDELVEITPKNVRLRKRLLNEADRRKAERATRNAAMAGA